MKQWSYKNFNYFHWMPSFSTYKAWKIEIPAIPKDKFIASELPVLAPATFLIYNYLGRPNLSSFTTYSIVR